MKSPPHLPAINNSSQNSKKERVNWIDTLKFLAFLLIMFRHFQINFITADMMDIFSPTFKYYQAFYTGKLGVACFCILLGYFTADALWEKRGAFLSEAGHYIVHRYIRFVPPLLIVNTLVYTIKVFLLTNFRPIPVLTAIGVSNNMVKGTNTINSIFSDSFFFTDNLVKTFWCMDLFFIGSLICAMLLLCFGLKRKRWLFYFLALAITLSSDHVWVFNCLLGMVLYDGFKSRIKPFRVNNYSILFCYLVLAVILPWANENNTTFIRYGFASFFLMLFCLNITGIHRILDLKPLVWLGRRSFSMYLVHTPVHWFFTYFFIGSFYARVDYSNLLIISFIATLLIDICLACILFEVGEKYIPKKLENPIVQQFISEQEQVIG